MVLVDRFFKELDREVEFAVHIILTGAYAGMLMGNIRPSLDIDFEIEYEAAAGSHAASQRLDEAIAAVSARLGVPAQYSENIQGWGQISFLDYRKKAWRYKKFGKVDVKVLSPEHWTIGKMSRYLELDRSDIASVLKKKSLSWKKMVRLWAQALKQSPLSDRSKQFQNHVTGFLKEYGSKVWGEEFDAAEAVHLFVTLIQEKRKR